MKNLIQSGDRYTHVATAAISAGDLVQVGDMHGVAITDAEIGDSVELMMEGVFELPAEAAAAIAKGDTVYYDGGSVDKDNANKIVGKAFSAQDADDLVHVKLSN